MRAEQEAEFLEYVTARGERLRRFAYLCCGDWHRAEDAVQSALIKLYRAWPRTRIETVDAYTRRIVVNVVVSEHRRLWFHRERVSERLPEPMPSTVDNIRVEERRSLVEALQRLPQRQRAAIVLRYWEDLPVEQTARILGCSTGAARNLTMRGLQTLRGLLAADPDGVRVFENIEGVQS